MSIKDYFKTIWDNQKIEIAVLVGGIIFGLILYNNNDMFCNYKSLIVPMFDSDRVGLIVNAIAIILGIYIAVITILATSVLGITRDMLAKKKDQQLLHIVFSGMIINIIVVFYCVLFKIGTVWKTLALIVLLAIAFVSFLKFMHLMYLIFQANFEETAKIMTNNELEKQDMLTILKKIEQKLSTK